MLGRRSIFDSHYLTVSGKSFLRWSSITIRSNGYQPLSHPIGTTQELLGFVVRASPVRCEPTIAAAFQLLEFELIANRSTTSIDRPGNPP